MYRSVINNHIIECAHTLYTHTFRIYECGNISSKKFRGRKDQKYKQHSFLRKKKFCFFFSFDYGMYIAKISRTIEITI